MIKYLGHEEKKPSVIILENFYTEEELSLIWRELEFLTDKDKLYDASKTGPAYSIDMATEEKRPLKNNKGIFLDECYSDRNISDILKINRKIFFYALENRLVEYDPVFRVLIKCDTDKTLISYYEDGDYYEPHFDTSIVTVLSYFIKDEKEITGGEFVLNEFGVTIPVKNNMVIIIPSFYLHEVKEVKMSRNYFSTFGRYSMTQFLSNSR